MIGWLQGCKSKPIETSHSEAMHSGSPTTQSDNSGVENVRATSACAAVEAAVAEAICALSEQQLQAQNFNLFAKRDNGIWEVNFQIRTGILKNAVKPAPSVALEARELILSAPYSKAVDSRPLRVHVAVAVAVNSLTVRKQMPKDFTLRAEKIDDTWQVTFDAIPRRLHSDIIVVVYADGKAWVLPAGW